MGRGGNTRRKGKGEPSLPAEPWRAGLDASGVRFPFPGGRRVAGAGAGFVCIFKKSARTASLNSLEGQVLGAGQINALFPIPSSPSLLPASRCRSVNLHLVSFSSPFPDPGTGTRGSEGQRVLLCCSPPPETILYDKT